MIPEPKIMFRDEQNYIAIKSIVTRDEIPQKLPQLIPELFNWLASNKIKPGGSPFFNYIKMNSSRLEIEVGIPTNAKVETGGRIISNKFPAGKYAVAEYVGPYNNLFEVHKEIESWKEKNKIVFTSPKVEFYPTDPAAQPDSSKWVTIIINRLNE
jgi:effector-binding domain-containing protein